MPSQKVEIEAFSHFGGLRDLSQYSAAELEALPPDQRKLFDALKSAQDKVSAIHCRAQRRRRATCAKPVSLSMISWRRATAIIKRTFLQELQAMGVKTGATAGT